MKKTELVKDFAQRVYEELRPCLGDLLPAEICNDVHREFMRSATNSKIHVTDRVTGEGFTITVTYRPKPKDLKKGK